MNLHPEKSPASLAPESLTAIIINETEDNLTLEAGIYAIQSLTK